MVEIKEAGTSGWKRAAPGGFIESNTIISTGLKSSAVIVLGNSRLEVRPLTMLTMEELVQKEGIEETAVYLRTGRVRAEVRPPTGIQVDFRVKSPSVTASVRGTTFEFDGKNLWVGDGRVLLAGSNGQKVYVAKGQRSYVDGNNQNRIAPPFEAETARLRPVIPELNNTDSAGSANAGVPELTPGVVVHFILDW
ncbi:MAG: FecR family protein [Treponema sp.]|nr:FecR family protein [Treponema sp.]